MTRFLAGCAVLALGACGPAETPPSQAGGARAPISEPQGGAASRAGGRAAIQIVGSSTVFPFTTTVAESFGAKTEHPTPVVEQTGSGGGMKLFCSGVGESYPDVTNSSRRMKVDEWETCNANGVTEIVEIQIGFDGIVLARSKDNPPLDMTLKELFSAVAKSLPTSDDDCTLQPNPYTRWTEINPALPDTRIEVFGPPPTSGTRDAFVEIAMDKGAAQYPCLAELAETDEDAFEAVARTLREDQLWIDGGENDNALVQTLVKTPPAFGVFGYSFLEQNSDKILAVSVDGVAPSFENIASGAYPISRSMYVYVKRQHVGLIPGLEDFIAEYTSEGAWGEFGYLVDKGLIPLPQAERTRASMSAQDLEIMTGPPVGDAH